MKRAGLYIRVSSMAQAEKASPEEQENDCIERCQNQGYQVEEIYRDITQYRVGKKLVEPSGTRADRPAFKRMLVDAYSRRIDVVVAWREDRLYRSFRPMLDFLDCLEETDIDVELVKESFDKRIAPVKAWAAKMELDAKHDRTTMGVANKLKNGGMWFSNPPYGYDYTEGEILVNEEESEWVHLIWRWFGDGETIPEIRNRLITRGAKQRGTAPRKYVWSPYVIRQALKKDYYHTGLFPVKWDNKKYEIPIPTFIDTLTFQGVKKRLARWKQYPAGNYGNYALVAGSIYCSTCKVRMRAVHTRNQTGKKYLYYRCDNYGNSKSLPGCVGYVNLEQTDAEIWNKIWELLSTPGRFESALEERIAQLQVEEMDAGAEIEKLEQHIMEIDFERQKVITWARKDFITEDDLQVQLHALSSQEMDLRRELSDMKLLTGNRAERLIEFANLYREQVIAGRQALNTEPETSEHAEQQFKYRKKIIDAIVTKVEVLGDKSILVYTEIDFESMPSNVCISEQSSTTQ